jgi:YidC/Oxa1 family membrane protein insertase
MANNKFVFVDDQLQLLLNKLQWKSLPVEKTADGGQKAVFEAVITEGSLKNQIIKITKSFQITVDSYDVKVNVNLENLSSQQQKVRFNMTGPVGIEIEGARQDMRKALACFKNTEGAFATDRKEIKKLKDQPKENRRLTHDADKFIWASITNKYFAAILVPKPDLNNEYCDWVADKFGKYYDPDGIEKDGDETIGLDINIASNILEPASKPGSTRSYEFSLYLGPKDKPLFDKNEQYDKLGFVQSIDFRACCCPAAMIRPLVFGILLAMKTMYTVIPNYGIVIIILVFFIRLLMHPVTKKSQISMQKFGKIAPKVEELKKKYGNNKTELNRKTMALYKEQGASPIMGFLPMLVQMPIWISLYSAIYASIDLRGAAFLPFWITDLSAPDALIRFSAITIPILGYKLTALNLLPLLMGVAFYLQQKMMPKNASANPQAAQQQKMMMMMMPIMFPLMLYSAPSGLNLYIMASTFAGVIEQHVIRRHIQRQEQQESSGLVSVTSKTGGKVKKKKPKPFYKNT